SRRCGACSDESHPEHRLRRDRPAARRGLHCGRRAAGRPVRPGPIAAVARTDRAGRRTGRARRDRVARDRTDPVDVLPRRRRLLASVSGMLVVAAGRDLLTLLIGLEVVSLPAFVLVGLRRGDPRGAEAALKFFVFSVISTALTVYGIALIYGTTGSIELHHIARALALRHARAGAW